MKKPGDEKKLPKYANGGEDVMNNVSRNGSIMVRNHNEWHIEYWK